MLRLIPIAILITLSAPSHATEAARGDLIAQQQQAPQQMPKRDCEKKQDEGVS